MSAYVRSVKDGSKSFHSVKITGGSQAAYNKGGGDWKTSLEKNTWEMQV